MSRGAWLAAALCLSLGACGASDHGPDATGPSRKLIADCQRDAARGHPGAEADELPDISDLVADCMEAHGFLLDTALSYCTWTAADPAYRKPECYDRARPR